LFAEEQITVTVRELNAPPVLDPIANQTVDEGSLLRLPLTATDPDVPANTLTFSLDPVTPAGASIDPATGVFTWTPTEAQGPGSTPIPGRVPDNGPPALSDSKTFPVTVNEVNQPPVLNPIGNRTVNEGGLLTFTASASDPDLPANRLTFSLDP